MRVCQIKLNAFSDVRSFVDAAFAFDDEVDIVTDTHKINAKSLLGMMTLDLSVPLTLRSSMILMISAMCAPASAGTVPALWILESTVRLASGIPTVAL